MSSHTPSTKFRLTVSLDPENATRFKNFCLIQGCNHGEFALKLIQDGIKREMDALLAQFVEDKSPCCKLIEEVHKNRLFPPESLSPIQPESKGVIYPPVRQSVQGQASGQLIHNSPGSQP